ncbi:MAG TPA: hypothetical protein DEW22_06850 [Clostridiales bacterium]|nr:hypothetical protein [Clostridiales bacterium]
MCPRPSRRKRAVMFEKILSEIKKYDRIIIHRHTSPDGDAVGSQVGLKHIILENFPGKEVWAVGDAPRRYAFMDDSAPDIIPDEYFGGALAIILDTSAASLISDTRYTLAAATARIDHHIFLGQLADTEVIDTSYESCCGLVVEMARECGLRLTPTAAKSLYTGMVTDSGRFRYSSTTARTFALAAYLMEQPFSITDIYTQLYADDFDMIRLRAGFVLKIKFTQNHVAYIYTTRDEMAELGLDDFTVSRGMVGTMADIRGVDIWVNFTESERGVLCEIRSGKYNINPVAVKYGGGGHAGASGATLPDRETAMALLGDLDLMIGDGKNEQ